MKYFKERYNSFHYAFSGLREMILTQPNFIIELITVVILIIAGAILKISQTEWLVMIMVMGLVLVIEILNTTVEYIVDFISPEFHPLAGKIKDLSAAASLTSAIISVIIEGIIFIPKIYALI